MIFLLSVDIDECNNPDNCQYGTCVNQKGTYLCVCPQNYVLNPSGTGCVGEYMWLIDRGALSQPLCLNRFVSTACINHFVSTTLYQPLCINRYVSTTLSQPLCLNRFALTALYQLLCLSTTLSLPLCLN